MTNLILPRWDDGISRFDRGLRYPTAAELLAAQQQKTQKGPMRTQRYYPSRVGDQIRWHNNFAEKLPDYTTILGLVPAQVDVIVASSKYAAYVLGTWLPEVRNFGPTASAAVDLLMNGTGSTVQPLPGFEAPDLPEGVVAVPTGIVPRVFDFAQLIKDNPACTDAILQALGLNTPTANTPSTGTVPTPPIIKCMLVDGAHNEAVNLGYQKLGHTAVYIECQRANGAWEFVATATTIPYHDDRALLVAGTPESRKYRMRYWDKDTAASDWSAVESITVGL